MSASHESPPANIASAKSQEVKPSAKPVREDRIAAIDIGSNSVRLEVAQVDASGGYRVLDEERENTRLANALDDTGRLDSVAVEATFVALTNFMSIARGYRVSKVRAIATSAIRDATNGDEFCKRVEHELGLKIEIISAREEGRLAFFSVAKAFDISDQQVAVADMGGGSTEILLASSELIDAVYATRLGAVRVAERCALTDRCDRRRLASATDYIDKQLKKHISKLPFVPTALYGTGGTFTAMASVLIARQNADPDIQVRGFEVQRAEVHHLMRDMAELTLEKRRKVTGLNPRRADIIVAGLLVIERIMRRLQVNVLRVHSRGVRDGLLLTMIADSGNHAATADERDAAVAQFAQDCGVELTHARQVARIAGDLVEQLAEPLSLNVTDRPLIESAALLANVGYLINFDKHHKHSYHLIINSDLRGFDPQELRILANIARYHRGSRPKRKHKGYAALASEDQERVAKLAAILRLALALDRTHRQQVKEVSCKVLDDRVEITVRADGDAEVDLWSARRKADLFERVFNRQPVFNVAVDRKA